MMTDRNNKDLTTLKDVTKCKVHLTEGKKKRVVRGEIQAIHTATESVTVNLETAKGGLDQRTVPAIDIEII